MLDKIQEYLIKNKEILEQAINLDNNKWNTNIKFEDLLETLKNITFMPEIPNKNSSTYIVLYNGNPDVTLTLAIAGLVTNSNMIFMIYDDMLATNTVLVKMFEKMLDKIKRKNFVKLYNNIKKEDIKKSMNLADKIILIGDEFEYETTKRDFNIPIIYIEEQSLFKFDINKLC